MVGCPMRKVGSIQVVGETMKVFTERYKTGNRLAVFINCEDGSPFCVASINVTDALGIQKNEFVLSHDITSVVKDDLLRSGMFEDTGKQASYGRVTGQPVWRLVKRS